MADTPSYEEKTEMQYNAFIKKALATEVKWFFKELHQQMARQSLFSELDEEQTEYFEDSGALEAFADIEAVFRAGNHVLIETFTGKTFLYKAVDLQTREITRLFYTKRQLTEKKA